MPTTKTRAELATNVLQDLGLVAAEETPAAADQQWVIARWDAAAEELREKGLVYWEPDAIPLVLFEPLTQYMRLVVGPSFGIPALFESLTRAFDLAELRIRKLMVKQTAGEAVRIDYF